MKATLNSTNPKTIATCAKSFKYSSHKSTQPHIFRQFIPTLIKLIGHADIGIKRNTLEALTEICFNRSLCHELKQYTNDMIKLSLAETDIRKDLITQVDLGPFKYTVDNGAPIRKAAFNLLEVMVERFQINQPVIVDKVIQGFADSNEDVRLVALNFMVLLIQVCPMIVINKLDGIVEKMQQIFQKFAPDLKKKDA